METSARFCPACGCRVGDSSPAQQTPDGTEIAGDAMEWDFSFPLATNRFFLYDMAKALSGPSSFSTSLLFPSSYSRRTAKLFCHF
jgi:hypothetical protein